MGGEERVAAGRRDAGQIAAGSAQVGSTADFDGNEAIDPDQPLGAAEGLGLHHQHRVRGKNGSRPRCEEVDSRRRRDRADLNVFGRHRLTR